MKFTIIILIYKSVPKQKYVLHNTYALSNICPTYLGQSIQIFEFKFVLDCCMINMNRVLYESLFQLSLNFDIFVCIGTIVSLTKLLLES